MSFSDCFGKFITVRGVHVDHLADNCFTAGWGLLDYTPTTFATTFQVFVKYSWLVGKVSQIEIQKKGNYIIAVIKNPAVIHHKIISDQSQNDFVMVAIMSKISHYG